MKKRWFNLIDKKKDAQKLMINIGGGEYVRRHWKVLDYISDHYSHRNIYIDYNFDLTSNKPLPFSDNSVALFFTSHTLEHIPQEFCQFILNEIYRCLKKSGGIRLTMPDFDLAYEAFGKKNESFFTKLSGKDIGEKFLDFFASYFKGKISLKELEEKYHSMGKEEFANYFTLKIPRHSQKKSPGNHINWWNSDKLKRMLKIAGFKTIYRSKPQKSKFSEMRGVGVNSGFDSKNPELSLFVEAIK
ncbi:MAG: class I SAM-dependent methyltransferase [Candidatus Helarchaeota archaeon]